MYKVLLFKFRRHLCKGSILVSDQLNSYHHFFEFPRRSLTESFNCTCDNYLSAIFTTWLKRCYRSRTNPDRGKVKDLKIKKI